MPIIKVKGYEFNAISITDSFSRRAQLYYNNIIKTFKAIGVTEDDIDVILEPVGIKRLPASISIYVEGFHLHYSYKGCAKFVENLYVISKVMQFEVEAILTGTKTINEFIRDFAEEQDIAQQRKEARDFLDIHEDEIDLALISKKYKKMALELHPDMPNGDTDRFKALNRAHKILKRELE